MRVTDAPASLTTLSLSRSGSAATARLPSAVTISVPPDMGGGGTAAFAGTPKSGPVLTPQTEAPGPNGATHIEPGVAHSLVALQNWIPASRPGPAQPAVLSWQPVAQQI